MSKSSRKPGSWEDKARRLAKHNLIEEERKNSLKEIDRLLEEEAADTEWWDRAGFDEG